MSLHPIVRHEAAESLGAIGLAGNAEILKQSLVLDPAQEVRETCELALKRIEDLSSVDAEKELDTTKTAHAAAFSSVHQLRFFQMKLKACMRDMLHFSL
ncbi:PREDICTED: deoxyhypusine hydroxylase-like isoform X2 [Brassica oleracea var. oleracea]|uniref:deoxyhypusine hydroxylase-like isoform X2 n=1 Tax=Brassica oleracea var. oleracea TaxID=109376 RepID=UPI0006A731E3|nr:PREDICTED: deoxyhypusine hydroxylase-like isoform X2 [Brassica oleracea var. oleracea]